MKYALKEYKYRGGAYDARHERNVTLHTVRSKHEIDGKTRSLEIKQLKR